MSTGCLPKEGTGQRCPCTLQGGESAGAPRGRRRAVVCLLICGCSWSEGQRTEEEEENSGEARARKEAGTCWGGQRNFKTQTTVFSFNLGV